MRRVETSVSIAADPGEVWAVLTGFADYPQWSPTLRRITGTPVVGGHLTVTAAAPGGRAVTFRPVVLAVETARVLRWRARLLLPGLLTGVHEFVLEPEDGGTRLVHADTFSGIAVAPLGGLITRNEAGMRAQNAALKRRAEAWHRTPPATAR